MPTAFQLRTYVDIITQMFATARTQNGDDIDLNVGSILRTFYEAAALQDAEQYVQIAKLLDLFSIDNAQDDDLDRRGLDFGAALFEKMRRRAAQTSIAELLVGDGTLQLLTKLASDVVATSTTFSVLDGSAFPIAGSVVLERGTSREEEIVYTRAGDVFTIIFPVAGLLFPHSANGRVETLSTKSLITNSISVGGTTAVLQSGTETAWPSSGTVIFERDTVRRESRTFTRSGVTLTVPATTFAHAAGTDVILSTFGSDRAIASGLIAFVPETAAARRINYRLTEAGSLKDGDYVSSLLSAESEVPGAQTLAGSNQITKWQSEPFANATVINPNASVRGRDRESDESYIERVKDFIQSLSRATALAIETGVSGERDPFSNLIVAFAQTVEPVLVGQSQLYISDGSTTFAIDYQVFTGRDVLISDARPGDKRARLNNYGPFKQISTPAASRTPRLYKSVERGVATSVGADFLEDTTKTWTVNQFAGFVLKTDDDQFYPIVSNTAIRLTITAGGATPSLGSYSIFNFAVDPLTPGTDYIFNQSNGNLELTVALVEHDGLVAASDGAAASVGAYTFSRGLAAFVQRLVNGDVTDLDNFPGLKALGTACLVVAPTIVSPTFIIQIVTNTGLADDDLTITVKNVVQAYVNSLGIGQPVILAEIIRLVKGLAGVRDVRVISPTTNVTVPDGQLARIDEFNVEVV